MRVAIVGAGLGGLATAAAFNRSGHEVTVYEQADALRASGLAINLWSNATSLLPGLGIPADSIPGEPFSRMLLRAAGREVSTIELPAAGLPHVTVERGALLDALAGTLPDGVVHYGIRCTGVDELAREYDLVVVADGSNSTLRSEVTGPVGRRWTWRIWQASVIADVPEVSTGTGASVTRAGMFTGVWRLGGQRFTWFAEQPRRESGDGDGLLRELRADEDLVLRALAAATSPEEWIEWRAQDMWPRRRLHRGNVVLVGDAAHAMLPTLGQGACQAVEDAATLAAAVAADDDLDRALRRYAAARVPRLRWLLALTRAGAVSRRPNVTGRTAPAVLVARTMARTGGPVLRRLSRPRIPAPRRLGK